MAADDAWYESEESTRVGLIQELRRLVRRARARPLPVLALAALLSTAITYRIATRGASYEAVVVLALGEGAFATKRTGMPLLELRDFVGSVLLPDARLEELIEAHDLHPLRAQLGVKYAVAELRSQFSIEVSRNSFVYYDPEAPNPEHSARIRITVRDDDPDRAFLIARELGQLVTRSVREHRQNIARQVAGELAALRTQLTARLAELEALRGDRQVAFTQAQRAGKTGVAQAILLQLAEIDRQQLSAEKTLAQIAQSDDALADRVAAAGLDLVIAIADEIRPERPEHRAFALALVAVVVTLASLLAAALLLGAFDSRVHDADDVARLGLPVLGNVPGFAGDRVGALEARGVQRRVPARSRWRT